MNQSQVVHVIVDDVIDRKTAKSNMWWEKYHFIQKNIFASSIYFLFKVCGVLPDTSGRIEDKTVEQYYRPFRKSSPDQTREGLYKIISSDEKVFSWIIDKIKSWTESLPRWRWSPDLCRRGRGHQPVSSAETEALPAEGRCDLRCSLDAPGQLEQVKQLEIQEISKYDIIN